MTGTLDLTKAAHVGIAVADLDRSVQFYRTLTGREPIVSHEHIHGQGFAETEGLSGHAEVRYATFNLENIGIDLIEFQAPQGEPSNPAANRPGSAHLCFHVEDVDATCKRIIDAGIPLLGEPYTFAEGEVTPDDAVGTRVAYFNDPDGTNLEIIAPKGGFAN
ncbi:VOC family protein [Streptomyces sp. gb14]|uniref:VOC family protein n=1 Tax=Streptomyces sp. gb14 TaxID=1827753 RepID=UPI000BF189C4|nr:VOC family protein [Streptomyces sp. gb14]